MLGSTEATTEGMLESPTFQVRPGIESSALYPASDDLYPRVWSLGVGVGVGTLAKLLVVFEATKREQTRAGCAHCLGQL